MGYAHISTLKQDNINIENKKCVEISNEKVFSNCEKNTRMRKRVIFTNMSFTYADAVRNE